MPDENIDQPTCLGRGCLVGFAVGFSVMIEIAANPDVGDPVPLSDGRLWLPTLSCPSSRPARVGRSVGGDDGTDVANGANVGGGAGA